MRIADIIWLDEFVDKLRRKHRVYKEDRSALILSARDMAAKDRRRYERR